MSVAVEEKLYTVGEYLGLDWEDWADESDEAGEDYELIGGRIVARQGHTSGKHGDIVTRIATELNIFAGVKAGPKRTGTVFTEASCTLGLPKGLNLPKPDVCFVLKEHLPADFDGPIPVAPDLAVEIWSPSDTDERRVDKITAYQTAGVPLIWSIHMLEKYITVYALNKPRRFLDLGDALSGDEVLPGFSLPLQALFD